MKDDNNTTVQRVTRKTRRVARVMAAHESRTVPKVIEESVIERALRTGVPVTLKYKPAKRKQLGDAKP